MSIRNVRRNQDGQAMVEFVLVAPVLLLLIFGIVQFGILFNNYMTLTDATRAGARQAAVSRTLPDPEGKTKDRVVRAASDLDVDALEITVEPYDPSKGSKTWAQGGDVTVTVKYPYSINLLGFVVKSGQITSETTERVE
jgi:Flp pilus assembly protein TadG